MAAVSISLPLLSGSEVLLHGAHDVRLHVGELRVERVLPGLEAPLHGGVALGGLLGVVDDVLLNRAQLLELGDLVAELRDLLVARVVAEPREAVLRRQLMENRTLGRKDWTLCSR